MKRIAIVVMALVLLSPFVMAVQAPGAQGGQGNDQGPGDETPPAPPQGGGEQGQDDQGQGGAEQGLTVATQARKIKEAGDPQELKTFVKQRKQQFQEQANQTRKELRGIHQRQNRVRLAVHTMLAAGNLTGGIGQNISKIAREFNNSVQKTIQAEERIKTRSRIAKFFVGGDQEAAETIQAQVNQNQQRIQKLNQLLEDCEGCDSEVKAILEEQIQNLEQEQQRLEQVAQEEKQNKGIFGWLFR